MASPDIEILFDRLYELNSQRDKIGKQIKFIQDNCPHNSLPKRNPQVEQYRDICPDCGYVQYCYTIG